MSLFVCPVCGEKLERGEKSYTCPAGHGFDLASEGYVNLLPANKKHSKQPGDDKNMVRARKRFLSLGYYEPLRRAISELALGLQTSKPVILDSGCGEGYYTEGIAEAFMSLGKAPRIVGIDISKEAVRLAAKRLKNAEFAVASAYHLPLAGGSADLILNCFSPLCVPEFLRVLKKGGHFIYVVPAPRHLWELKCAVYDSPYENERVTAEYEGFELVRTDELEKRALIEGKQGISDLFAMTPYFWKTPKEGLARLEKLETLETELSFVICVYKKS